MKVLREQFLGNFKGFRKKNGRGFYKTLYSRCKIINVYCLPKWCQNNVPAHINQIITFLFDFHFNTGDSVIFYQYYLSCCINHSSIDGFLVINLSRWQKVNNMCRFKYFRKHALYVICISWGAWCQNGLPQQAELSEHIRGCTECGDPNLTSVNFYARQVGPLPELGQIEATSNVWY